MATQGLTITEKIIKSHLVEGEMIKGKEIAIRIDQTLTQDSTGTMAYLQFEAMGVDKVKTKKSVAYIDHNMLQQGFENADDHKYIQTVASKHGVYFSRPGNGICHQVHLERFSKPGETLLGSDSHTPTGGGAGMLAIGAGGLDVAAAMGGRPYAINMPEIVGVNLTGKLRPFVSSKDVILEVLRILSVKGGVGRVIEYKGDGVKTLSVPERATITNMGAELGATTSVFPADEITKAFFEVQDRLDDFTFLEADKDAVYDMEINIDLSTLEPLVAMPHSPDNVAKVSEQEGIAVDQVMVGSCTNGSYLDLMRVAKILEGKSVHPNVSLVVAPGSKQVLTALAENGALKILVDAGARILESGCGPCIGMGQAPASNAVSLRTINRNFFGRCGTKSASVYLVSPEVAAVSAIEGKLVNPRKLEGKIDLTIEMPEKFYVNDNMIIDPAKKGEEGDVVRGPNIKPFPLNTVLPDSIDGVVLTKLEDNITTDHIMPSDAKLLPFRSNIPHLSDFCLTPSDADFPKKAKENGGGFILAGDNYGQGSSREHAALVPLYLGIKGVIAKSFARIHKANLINSGIIPMLVSAEDYETIKPTDKLTFADIRKQLAEGAVTAKDQNGKEYTFKVEISEKELEMLYFGGKINWIKVNQDK